MASVARVSVPGKLILMGEHAAVYGGPAVVAALGMRLRAEARGVPQPGVDLRLPGIGVARRVTWREVFDATATARAAWDLYAADPGPATFAALHSNDPAALVQLAIGEAARPIAGELPPTPALPGLRLELASEIPVGAGFGSSAAAALAIVAAVQGVLRGDIDWSRVQETVGQVERRQHGSPSGVDAAAVLHGGVIRAQRQRDELLIEPLAARPERLARLRVYSTGAPAESTGQVVAAVRCRRDADRQRFDEVLTRMRAHTRQLAQALVTASTADDDVMAPIRGYHRCLCDLGVVPHPVEQLVTRVERAGGAAKISGAGSIGGPGAGSLLLVHPDPEAIERDDLISGLLPYRVAIGVEGARVEQLGVSS